MKLFSCSTQLRMKFILLINVKMPIIVGILTFISRINTTTSESFKARKIFIFMPPPFVMGEAHIASPLSVRTYRTYVRTKKGFRAISFEYIGALDSYFIHRYIIIKYRSSSIRD